MQTRMSSTGPRGVNSDQREGSASPAIEARLSLGVFLFRKRKSRSPLQGAGMQKMEREAIAVQRNCFTRTCAERSRSSREDRGGERQNVITRRPQADVVISVWNGSRYG